MVLQSISHTSWKCTYHIVFIPKYRRKAMYGQYRKDMGQILRKICEMNGVTLIEGKVCLDHVHMYVAIPPKMSVSKFVGTLKGKSTLMFFDKHPELKDKYNRHFWAVGYFVSTVGEVNEATIVEYIKNQEEADKNS